MDYSFRGECPHIVVLFQLSQLKDTWGGCCRGSLSNSSFCGLSGKGVSEQQRIAASLRVPDHSSAQPADHVRVGALLDVSQPLQKPLCAQPALSGIPVSFLQTCHPHSAVADTHCPLIVSGREIFLCVAGLACTSRFVAFIRRGVKAKRRHQTATTKLTPSRLNSQSHLSSDQETSSF